MKTALVLGGTRFFGVHLVEALLSKGVKVTIGTRGETKDPFGNRVERVNVDRFSEESMKNLASGRSFDVLFDQIGYSSSDIEKSLKVFKGKIGKYIFTSSMSVYEGNGRLIESDFDPSTKKLVVKEKENGTYQEGKQLAEAYLDQNNDVPYVAVRFPIVLGENDYTERLDFHVKKILNEEPMYFPNLDASISFIHEEEAGKFLLYVAEQEFNGPINACTNGTIILKDLIQTIEKSANKQANFTKEPSESTSSPYGIDENWTLINHKAVEIGFPFGELSNWLPKLIQKRVTKFRG
jgi:nucleoside-diphosphate-sugar epimerase